MNQNTLKDVLIAVLMLAVALLFYVLHIKRFQILEIRSLYETQISGKRVAPFHCSDAKEYFAKINVIVDCERIEEEVNGSKN